MSIKNNMTPLEVVKAIKELYQESIYSNTHSTSCFLGDGKNKEFTLNLKDDISHIRLYDDENDNLSVQSIIIIDDNTHKQVYPDVTIQNGVSNYSDTVTVSFSEIPSEYQYRCRIVYSISH